MGRFRALLAAISLLSALACRTSHSPIMSWSEYASARHTFPIVLDIQCQGGRLLYIGARHTNDPESEDVRLIERLWSEIRPTRAFNEGGEPPIAPTREETIRNHGESALVRFLAHRDGVPVESPDPSKAEQTRALESAVAPERIKLFFVLLQVRHHRDNPVEPLDVRLRRVFEVLNATPGLEGPPRDRTELERMYAELFDRADFRSVPAEWFDPVRQGTFLNDIARTSSEFRDESMVRRLVAAVQNGERVFAVAGGTHVVMQERAIVSRVARYGCSASRRR